MRLQPSRGSYLPWLMKLVQTTTGPILELGCGAYSTHYLHWACYATKRRLVTYEHNPEYYEYLQQFARDYHEIRCVPSWPEVDLSEPWTIAFVDCDGGPRKIVVAKLAHAEYVLCHDTDSRATRQHGYRRVFRHFKYEKQFREALPSSTLLSNFHDIRDFDIR